jgi:hypothetical protein
VTPDHRQLFDAVRPKFWGAAALRNSGRQSALIWLQTADTPKPPDCDEPDATTRPAPQDNQLMSKHRVLGFKPQLQLCGQDGQNEAEQPDHPPSLGDSNAASHSDMVFGTHRTEIEADLSESNTTRQAQLLIIL